LKQFETIGGGSLRARKSALAMSADLQTKAFKPLAVATSRQKMPQE